MMTAILPRVFSNPHDSRQSRIWSNYSGPQEGGAKLTLPFDLSESPTPQAEFIHDSFRALTLNPRFACVAARGAVQRGTYRLGVYPDMATPDATAGLVRDLWTFTREQDKWGGEFSSFAAVFEGPTALEETDFEASLWTQLQALHEADAENWDASVSRDPNSSDFSFSFAGRAFFVIGLHPASSRWTRRFAWPMLVFNAHRQFEQLRADGRMDKLTGSIRARDAALQGAENAMLTQFGERSEARQYAGRVVGDDWKCPFHPRHE